MDPQQKVLSNNEAIDYNGQDGMICLHAFCNLSHTSPVTFVYLLKQCYLYGTRTPAQKFKALRQHVSQAFYNAPQPGPATFIVQCLYVVPLLGLPNAKVFNSLLMSSLLHLRAMETAQIDFSKAKHLAARLFLDILSCSIEHEEQILTKLLEIFDFELKDIGEAICGSYLDGSVDIAETFVEHHISNFINSQSYATAATLLEHFSIRLSSDTLLLKMVQSNQFKPAEKWATFMGRPMICLLVQKYLDMDMLKNANDIIQKNDLNLEFPHVHHLYKKSILKKFAEKGCWDIAEQRAKSNRQLIEYLVYLALEHDYIEKVEELCQLYSLDGLVNVTVPDESSSGSRFLDLNKLGLDDIVWVDEIDGLLTATNYIEACKVVGLDCEWKPNYVKGSKPNKVSIIQIASEKRAFIFDLMKLYKHEPKALNSCFWRILCSPDILKLGYSLECDLHELSHSYGDLECFRYYEMFLDMKKLFNGSSGGLSGLTEKILGAGLNKTRRNSDWEQRPLSQNQIEYAALDAAVLVRIFHHVRDQPHCSGKHYQSTHHQWKSHIVSRMENRRDSS